MPIDAGLFVGGAITIAIDPADANHLFYATDTRLLQSRNGGRDWVQDPSPFFIGPTLGVAFAREGKAVLAATAAGVFISDSGAEWKSVNISPSASPALTVLAGARPAQFLVVGAHGTYRSDDRGQTWKRLGEALPAAPSALMISADDAHALLAIVQGSPFVSTDDGATWQEHRSGLSNVSLEMLTGDVVAKRVWAGGGQPAVPQRRRRIDLDRRRSAVSRSRHAGPRGDRLRRRQHALRLDLIAASIAAPMPVTPGFNSKAICRYIWRPAPWCAIRTMQRRCTCRFL
jgi:hypothetical protein